MPGGFTYQVATMVDQTNWFFHVLDDENDQVPHFDFELVGFVQDFAIHE
jgi:hypothetical protein